MGWGVGGDAAEADVPHVAAALVPGGLQALAGLILRVCVCVWVGLMLRGFHRPTPKHTSIRAHTYIFLYIIYFKPHTRRRRQSWRAKSAAKSTCSDCGVWV